MSWQREKLAYCTNVHPGECVREISENLDRFVGPVRESLAVASISAGLWISNKASLDLQTSATVEDLREQLANNRLTLHSLNGFPFGDFHQDIIKESVYLPDWSEPSRLHYTRTLAKLLAECLPANESCGTISTLPLGFRQSWTLEKHQRALENILQLAKFLEQLEKSMGKHVRVCLEMEPACVLEKTDELVVFFTQDLCKLAQKEKYPVDKIFRYLGVCYDVCHQAVMFECSRDSLEKIRNAGIAIGKIQLSSALLLKGCHAAEIREQLQDFAEPRYLHQTSVRHTDGRIDFYVDLPHALDACSADPGQEWRIHYHVPLQLNEINVCGLHTTQFAIEEVFSFLAENRQIQPHLEVETYTWKLLPESLRPVDDKSLIRGIATELEYVHERLSRHGLLDKETDEHKAA